MFGCEVYAVVALCEAIAPRSPPKPRTPEQQASDSIREIRTAMATFAFQGAMFAPTSDASIQYFEQYMKLQTEMLMADVERSLKACQPSEH